jgi:hypothetical protein
MDDSIRFQISTSLERTRELIDSKMLWKTDRDIFRQSVLIEVLILMKDLLIKSEIHLDKRISFKDDVIPDENLKITDVTDLISNFRDAACHSDSFRKKFGGFDLSFNEIIGKGNFGTFGGITIASNYQDEITFNMGKNILYLKRHLERAFNEVDTLFKSAVS